MLDSSSRSAGSVNRALVALTLSDGSEGNFSVRLTLTNKIADALNNGDLYLDALTMAGDQVFIAKSDVRQVRLVDVPKASQLNFYRRASDRATFDPFAVLNLKKGATPDEIKQAYHQLTLKYHPDRLSAYDLPGEMQEYARTMQVRINLAYEQIAG